MQNKNPFVSNNLQTSEEGGGELTLIGVFNNDVSSSIMGRNGSGFMLLPPPPLSSSSPTPPPPFTPQPPCCVDTSSGKVISINEDSEGVGDGVRGGCNFVAGIRLRLESCRGSLLFMTLGMTDFSPSDPPLTGTNISVSAPTPIGDMAGDGMLICGGDFSVAVGWIAVAAMTAVAP